MSRGKRNLHDEDLRLRCPGCAKVFKTREGVRGHIRSSLHGEWITDFSMPDPAASGTEAGTGETPLRLDPKGDGPVPERQTPNLSKHIGSE